MKRAAHEPLGRPPPFGKPDTDEVTERRQQREGKDRQQKLTPDPADDGRCIMP
ncbi:hypothetical protein [Qipengyuania atrilutea]|uniref:Uncharacterized protein n=1 Tax=Qipengyuania atrilutea TaxID=2744473 RepID=A0A850H4T7_9SPHN|nr:hypothetical protein [Actirhodobacter atriluteus]NVD45640.1 hypothetical protein [Actirhodobacter atriluteus]